MEHDDDKCFNAEEAGGKQLHPVLPVNSLKSEKASFSFQYYVLIIITNEILA